MSRPEPSAMSKMLHLVDTKKVPTLAEVSPTYAALWKKFIELGAERGRLEDARRALIQKTMGNNAGVNTGHSPSMAVRQSLTPDENVHRQLVAEYLGEPVPTQPAPAAPNEMAELNEKIKALTEAEEILRRKIERERSPASALVCAAVKDRHAALMQRVANTVLDAWRAHAEYQQLAAELNGNGINWSELSPVFPHFFDSRHDVCRFVHDCVEEGWLAAGEIPKELR